MGGPAEETMAKQELAAEESVVAWYAGRSILVTGGAGFMGKVLIEKMLRSLPGIERIFLLLRAKRGDSPTQRVHNMLKLPIFDQLRKERPEAFSKVVAVEGDILQEDLGLSPADADTLKREVSVVFHGAASLRMEADMATALKHNVAGTHHVLLLCKQMKQLEVFAHLSTAFCYPDRMELDERVYPPPVPPKGLLQLAAWLDERTLDLITPRLLGEHPNCYTFTKRLAEGLVDQFKDDFTVCIIRPSIVSPALHEPLPGWVDSLNGPVGLAVGAGKGVIRSMLCRRDLQAQAVPVDIAVNIIITAAWDTAVQNSREKQHETRVYNATVGDLVPVTWGYVLDEGRKFAYEYPFEGVVWYPDGDIRTSKIAHALLVFFFHTLPALFIDFILLLTFQKPFMVRLQRRISAGLQVLQYFTLRPWPFKNDVAISLGKRIPPDERYSFYISDMAFDVDAYLLSSYLGARQYCMKEPLTSIARSRIRLRIMYVVHTLAKLAFWYFLISFVISYVPPLQAAVDWATEGIREAVSRRLGTQPIAAAE